MLRRTLDGACALARRSARTFARLLASLEEPGVSPAPMPQTAAIPPPAPAGPDLEMVQALSARVDRLAEGFELWRLRFEADQLAWQRLAADEARVREARILDHLARASARYPIDPFESRSSLRAPRVPSELEPRPSSAQGSVMDAGRSPPPGPSVRGAIEGVSLATLLGAFELERRDGIFRLTAPDGTVELDLRRGAIVRARTNGDDVEIVTALERAFDFKSAQFEFIRVSVTADSDAPLSLNGLLLEVLHRHDEARRAM